MSSTPAMTENNITSAAFEASALCSAGMPYAADGSLMMSSAGSNDSTRDLLRTPMLEIKEESFFGGELFDAPFGG